MLNETMDEMMDIVSACKWFSTSTSYIIVQLNKRLCEIIFVNNVQLLAKAKCFYFIGPS